MARNLRTLLAFEARRSSFIAEQVNNLSKLSDYDIDSLPIKPWIKKALKITKLDIEKQNLPISEQAILANTRFFLAADPIGRTFEFTGTTKFVKLDRGELELNQGALYWMPETGGILYETLFSRYVDTAINGRFISQSKRSEYVKDYKQKISRFTVPLEENNTLKSEQLQPYGVRVFR
jgi:hypothetical protein